MTCGIFKACRFLFLNKADEDVTRVIVQKMKKEIDIAYKGTDNERAAIAETGLRTTVLKQHCVPDRYHGGYP